MRSRSLLIGILIPVVILFLHTQDTWIQVAQYEVLLPVLPASFDGFRILHMSDLHGKMFGKDQKTLASVIQAQQPDLIVCSGDMLDVSEREEGAAFLALLRALDQRYPVYYGMGNHEQTLSLLDTEVFAAFCENAQQAGAILLNNETASIERQSDSITLYGANTMGSHYAEDGSVCWLGDNYDLPTMGELLGHRQENRTSILIAHDPKWYPVYAQWGADLVLAGHIHGGVIRLPFIGGLLSPDRTWFPQYDAGVYRSVGLTAMHVSRGLGDSMIPIRLFNRPDVSVIVLRRQSR